MDRLARRDLQSLSSDLGSFYRPLFLSAYATACPEPNVVRGFDSVRRGLRPSAAGHCEILHQSRKLWEALAVRGGKSNERLLVRAAGVAMNKNPKNSRHVLWQIFSVLGERIWGHLRKDTVVMETNS